MHRFFVPPESIQADRVILQDAVLHQLRHVLRMKPGESFIVLDNQGWQYTVVLHDETMAVITHRQPAANEPAVRITLYQALLKKDNFEWVLQKCTEIGVATFVPVESSRTIPRASDVNNHKIQRWQRIITEAAEQSRRGVLPALRTAQTFEQALEHIPAYDRALIPWENETARTIEEALRPEPFEQPRTVALFIGPEGGFSTDEITLASSRGAVPVSLGPRILRAETASIAAALLVLYELGADRHGADT